MPELVIAHTADLDAATLAAARALLAGAFGEGFTDHDWDHARGGVHVVLREGDDVVGHASVVQRRLLHGGRALRTGYVEGVGVRADRRGRGLGSRLMDAAEHLVRGGYELGALSATDDGARLYTARGWVQWRGPSSVLSPTGPRRTPGDDGSLFVLPGEVPLDLDGALAGDWRDGDLW